MISREVPFKSRGSLQERGVEKPSVEELAYLLAELAAADYRYDQLDQKVARRLSEADPETIASLRALSDEEAWKVVETEHGRRVGERIPLATPVRLATARLIEQLGSDAS